MGAVRIGPMSSVWYQVTIRGDNNFITVGANTNIQDNTCIHISSKNHPTIIGDNVNIGHSSIVHACTLRDNAFVGMGSIVMDGAVIESDAMLAAGGLLTPRKLIPSGELWGGRPAIKIRDLTQLEVAENRRISYHYVEVGRAHRLGSSGAPFQNMTTHPLPSKS